MRELRTTYTAKLDFTANIKLREVEIRALDALVGYGDDAFIKHFYDKLGKSYMRDHEKGLRSFFATVRREVLPALSNINTAKRDIDDAIRKRESHNRKLAESSRKRRQEKEAEEALKAARRLIAQHEGEKLAESAKRAKVKKSKRKKAA